MIFFAILVAALGVAFLCWALFQLSVYALPFFLALTTGFAAARTGSGPVAALVLAVLVGVVSFIAGRAAYRPLASPAARYALIALFIGPAALAGYHAAHGLMSIGAAAEGWRIAMGVLGAIVVGWTAYLRLTVRPDWSRVGLARSA